MNLWMKRLGCAIAAIALGAAGLDPAIEAKTRAFLERPEQMESVRQALVTQAAALPFVCTGLTLTPAELLVDLPPPVFDAAGVMVEGRVRQRFLGGGCGSLRLLFNVWVVARPGAAVRTVSAFPGTSGAALDLQRTATPTATVAAGRVLGGCGSLEVMDTTEIGFDPAPAAGSWREVWLVGGCGMFARVMLHFMPDARGGATRVEAPADGVQRVQLR